MLATIESVVKDSSCQSVVVEEKIKWKEPLRSEWLQIGDLVASPGGTIIYQIVSAPFARIYWDKGAATCNTMESSWWKEESSNRYRKSEPNYYSYEAITVGGTMVFPLTVRKEFKRIGNAPLVEGLYCFIEQHS